MTTVCLPTESAVRRVRAAGPVPDAVRLAVWDGLGDPPPDLGAVDMLVPKYGAEAWAEQALARLPGLRAIQLLSAGVEPWLALVPAGVLLCSGRGVHGASTAELAVAGMSYLLRELPQFARAQHEHRWDHRYTEGLAGKRVLVLGAGDIGRRIAGAVEQFGADATLVARHARDGVRTVAELPALLPQHDVVAVAVPRTPETDRMVDAAFLAAMPDGALLVNIARGSIVDTDALLAELTAGRLRAFLDVTDPEPLPAGHPLWDAPNLLLTPHVGGGTTGWQQRAYGLVREQVVRLYEGEPLVNVVATDY